jgi:hypothetical protein
LLVSLIFPLTRIVLRIKKTNGSPVPIDFLSFYIQTPCDILFSTKLLTGASIEKQRKTIRTGVGSRFLNCWTLIKKTNESPVPIDFLSFYIQIPCDILFSTKLLMGASIEKKRKQCKQVSALAFLIVGLVLDAEKDNIK